MSKVNKIAESIELLNETLNYISKSLKLSNIKLNELFETLTIHYERFDILEEKIYSQTDQFYQINENFRMQSDTLNDLLTLVRELIEKNPDHSTTKSTTTKSTTTKSDNCESNKEIAENAGKVRALLVLNDEVSLASASDKAIKIWNSETLELKSTLRGHIKNVKCLVLIRENLIASGSEVNF
jgi:WD40 repeat protein